MTKKKTNQEVASPTETTAQALLNVVEGEPAEEKIYFISCHECRKHWQEYGYATPCTSCSAPMQDYGMPEDEQIGTFEVSIEQAIQVMRDHGFEIFLDVKIDDCKEENGAKRRSFQRQGRYEVVLARGRRRV